MPRAKDTMDKMILRENYGVTRSVTTPKGRPNNGTKPGMTFFAVNDTGDDLDIGEVVEVLTYTASGSGIGYTIRKPSAVNLLNVAVCISKAPVGERVELSVDGTHTVSVSGTVALGATLGTRIGSTSLSSILVGDAGYPSIGFVAMSASSGGSCQARFFSWNLPCRQPDRVFATVARIGVGGGTEDVTVADLYALRDWIAANYSLAYHATLYADQTVGTDLILMPYNRRLILDGGQHTITVEADLNFRTTYARQIDFVIDGSSNIDMTTDTFTYNSTVFSNCTFSYAGTDPIRIQIGGALFCTCEFDFDLLEDDTYYGTRIEILPEYYMLNCDCTFTDRHITDEWRSTTKGVQIGTTTSTISDSRITLSDSNDVWSAGERSLYWRIYGRLIDSDYTISYPLTNTPTEYNFEDLPFAASDLIVLVFTHPHMERCNASVSIAPSLEGSLVYDANPTGGRNEYSHLDQIVRITQTHSGVQGMIYSPSIALVFTSPDGQGNGGDVGIAYVGISDSLTGEIISSTFSPIISAIGTCGNGADGEDGEDGEAGERGGGGTRGGCGGVFDVEIARNTNCDSIINSTLSSVVTAEANLGVGGNGGSGGSGGGAASAGGVVGNGANGEPGGNCGPTPPQYTHSYSVNTIANSTVSEVRSIAFSGSGGNGGAGGNGGSGDVGSGGGGRGGDGGGGYTSGNGGIGGNGGDSTDDGAGGYGGYGGYGGGSFYPDGIFIGGTGGAGGSGGEAGPNAPAYNTGGRGGDGGNGGWASEYTNGDAPNTAGLGGSGGTAGSGGTDGNDGSDGEAQGEDGPYPIYVFDEDSLAQLYKHFDATNTGYVPDDVWGGSMEEGDTIYIDPANGDDTNDGQSWAEAIENFPLFDRDGTDVGYLIANVEYAAFTGQQIGVLRPEATYGEVATYRTITGDDSTFTSNPAGLKISLLDCAGDFDGFDILEACEGTFTNCTDLRNCTGTLARYCTGVDLLGDSTTRFGDIEYCTDVTNCIADSFYGCANMSVCDGEGFENCYSLDLCDSHDAYRGFVNCSLLTNCDSYDNIDWGFYYSRQIDWITCREYDNGNSCDCPPTTKYPINCPNKDDCNA